MQSRTVTMGTNVYIGTAVTGNSTTTLATGTFNNVTVTGGGPTPTPTNTATNTPTATATSPGPTATPTNTPTPPVTPPPSQPEVIVQRTTYSIAGQTVFLRLRTLEDGLEVSSDLYALHSDQLGSTSTLSYLNPTDGSASRVLDSRAFYTPFGDYRLQPTGDYTDRGYTGQKENMEIGLIYYNARFYVPGIGRFASADTIVPSPADPQSFNRYAYSLNNPVNLVDPTGYRTCTAAQAATGDETCDQNITPAPSMPSPGLVGFNSSNTDPLPLLFYEKPYLFEMTAGVEYYASGVSRAAELLTPLVGQGRIPDIPGVLLEGYPVSFSIEDRDGDGIVEWVRYITVGGEVRVLFAAEWQFAGGLGFETFSIPAERRTPFIGSASTTLVLIPQHTAPGSIVLRGNAIQGLGAFPAGTYIEFVTTQLSASTIKTVGTLYVDYSRIAEIRFQGVYSPYSSSLLSVAPDYNSPR